MKIWHFKVSWEVSWHTWRNNGFSDDIDEEELCAEHRPYDGMLRACISNACGDGKQFRVLCVGVDYVSVFTFDRSMRLFHGLQIWHFAGLVLE